MAKSQTIASYTERVAFLNVYPKAEVSKRGKKNSVNGQKVNMLIFEGHMDFHWKC